MFGVSIYDTPMDNLSDMIWKKNIKNKIKVRLSEKKPNRSFFLQQRLLKKPRIHLLKAVV